MPTSPTEDPAATEPKLRFLEFFAGGGMARAGLGPGWQCVFTNDFDFKKVAAYQKNWGDAGEVQPGDVGKVKADNMMSPINMAKVTAAKRSGHRVVGGVYKRTRREAGVKVQRAEVRFDDVAGCLRTPAGGSSRQLILVVDRPVVRSRLLSSRETARLMGLPDSYKLPSRYNEAYHLTGDGVVVPVVRHLAHHLIEPLLTEAASAADAPVQSSVTAA